MKTSTDVLGTVRTKLIPPRYVFVLTRTPTDQLTTRYYNRRMWTKTRITNFIWRDTSTQFVLSLLEGER
jgi:hypothetical protein